MKWVKSSFEEFSKGTFGNGGQNIYVSTKGVLQRIFNFDINGDGYPDIPITNSHSMNEKPDIHIYDEIGQSEPLSLPSFGSFDAIFCDLYNRGVEDLIVACQHNGVNTDTSAIIFFGSERGLCENYRLTLRVPNSMAVAAGDFSGCGKKALAFTSGDKLRVFYQTELGIEAGVFSEYDINAISLSAGDLDGDGYDDLFAIRANTGDVVVYWGGKDGINPDRKTVFGPTVDVDNSRSTSTTEGRKLFRWVQWRCNVVETGEKKMIFRAEDNYAVFESFDSARKPIEELRIKCCDLDPNKTKGKVFAELEDAVFAGNGAMYACTGDLSGKGTKDIVIAVATDFDKIDDTLILWEQDGYALESATHIPVRAAKSVWVGKMGEKTCIFVAQAAKKDELTIETSVFAIDRERNYSEVWKIVADEPTRVISGKTYTDGRHQIAVINHEGERILGHEKVDIFLGGEDGYNDTRKISLPGYAAVDTIMCDFNDDGIPDVLVVNCAENAPNLSPGSAIYWQNEKGFELNNKIHFDSEMSHGAAIGDFRKCGYLDFITGGILSREIKIFEGGPDGYDIHNPKIIVLGPEPEKYLQESKGKDWGTKAMEMTPDIKKSFGQVRWLFAADFNGDGWLDIFVSEIMGDRSYIFWGGPDGFSSENYQLIATEGIASVNAADLNGDGYLDMICACHRAADYTNPQEMGRFVIYWGGEDGFKEYRKTELPTYCSNALTIQDFNNDGLLDIYGTAYSTGRCRDIDSKMYFQSADRVFHSKNFKNIFNHSGCGCLAGDFNNDGYMDLLVASHKAYGNHTNKSYVFWGGEDGINENRYTELSCKGPHGTCSVDIGNIMDRSDSEYYYSEPYKTIAKAKRVSWTAQNGKKTWVKIQFRCAESIDALENMEWSESFENGDDISSLNLAGYIQYKLELGAACGCGTPRVTEITVDFE